MHVSTILMNNKKPAESVFQLLKPNLFVSIQIYHTISEREHLQTLTHILLRTNYMHLPVPLTLFMLNSNTRWKFNIYLI